MGEREISIRQIGLLGTEDLQASLWRHAIGESRSNHLAKNRRIPQLQDRIRRSGAPEAFWKSQDAQGRFALEQRKENSSMRDMLVNDDSRSVLKKWQLERVKVR